MKLDFSSSDSVTSLAEDDIAQVDFSQTDSNEVTEMLRAGIKAAQRGDRVEARHILLQVTESDPKSESAWLWLASISEYPEELLIFLNNVLDINPENARAVEWAKATKSLLAKTFIQRGIEAQKQDQKHLSRQCFVQATVYDNSSEMAWLWMASVTDSEREKADCMRRVLQINPENETARQNLNADKEKTVRMFFEKASEAANEGDREQARTWLREVLEFNPKHEDAWILKSRLTDSFEEKIACFEKILEFNPANETARAGIKLRLMLNGNSVQNDSAASFPNEAAAEQLSAKEGIFEAAIDENQPEQYQYFGGRETEENLNENLNENQESANSELNEDFVPDTLFAGEVVSTSAETQEFRYFAESESDKQSEMFAAAPHVEVEIVDEERAEAEDYHFENNNAEIFSEENFQSNGNYAENFVKPEEYLANETYSRNSSEENTREYDYSEPQEPEENFSGYDANYEEEEDFAGNAEYPGDVQSVSFETNENGFYEENSEPENANEQNKMNDGQHSHKMQSETLDCPFCHQENEAQAFVCRSCHSMLTLSDMEMILAHQEADQEILQQAVERMEFEDISRGLESDELVNLAVGHINLKNFRKGLECLQKAAKFDSNNVVIESQATSLAIRIAEIEEKESVHSSMPKDRTIMVVDDSATVRKLISGKLEKCGHIVLTAVDGMDAMSKLGDVVPDLILLDITMPRMDGYQVCKLIRNTEATKDVPIVMISGKDGFFDKVRGRMAGTTGYITKPFGPETLMKMLDTYLS